jgi:hypothetical protein
MLESINFEAPRYAVSSLLPVCPFWLYSVYNNNNNNNNDVSYNN